MKLIGYYHFTYSVISIIMNKNKEFNGFHIFGIVLRYSLKEYCFNIHELVMKLLIRRSS